jgi:hypothetical protein
MSDPDETIPPAVSESLKRSGFPFQTAITHLIRRSKGWSIQASEYPWRDSDHNENFLDIIATNGTFILPIECKKAKEIQTFLLPQGGLEGLIRTRPDVADFRCLRTTYFPTENRVGITYEENCKIWPVSPSSEFCIVSTSTSGKDQRLLEKDASLPRLLLPLIVTNAKLFTARYHPSEVSLETGEFTESPPKDVEQAPWVRFSKTFTAGREGDHRSIFVVNAIYLEEFLAALELAPGE